jgi:hypothetical protein
MRKIRYENVALLALAAAFSVVATVVLSGFLEPSQPPAVAAVEIGAPSESQPREGRGDARERGERPSRGGAERRRGERRQADRSEADRTPTAASAAQPRPQPAPQPRPAPPLSTAPAERDDDAGEPADADDAAD